MLSNVLVQLPAQYHTIAAKPHPKSACLLQHSLGSVWCVYRAGSSEAEMRRVRTSHIPASH